MDPAAICCDDGVYFADCPVCGETIRLDSEEIDLGTDAAGRSLGHHTEPSLAKFNRHAAGHGGK
jgi:hypothetical protein